MQKVIQNSKVVIPNRKILAIEDDPDDNKILECAVTAKVNCIVSNDKHLLKLREFENIPIITSDEFAEKYL
ncbi:PIN domain-containing protein [Candidatus Woesearchaeota archaeon]|nr:PIN domain-containing protein [Candidatus Woesearchaeota archaeon]